MNLVLPAIVALVILVGLIAIAYDAFANRGWSWGTITGAILLLMSATGYFYLAARLADRERSWRTNVAKNEAEIARILGGSGGPAAGDSLAALRAKRDRWRRVQTFVDTWRGRYWQASGFSPPRDGKPGSMAVEMPSQEATAAPINVGAELAVFDNTSIDEGGRFLGIFRVLSAEAGKEDCQVTVAAADSPLPPSDADKALWSRDYDNVTVYENLPVDRWMAFQTVAGHAQEDDKATGPDSGDDDRWLPRPQRTADDRLQRLEEVMKHGREIPEEEWKTVADQLASGEIPQGSLWAVVEFENGVKFTLKDKFVLDETDGAPAEAEGKDGKKEDEDEGPAGAPGQMQPGEMLDPDAPGGAEGGVKRFATKRFAKGSRAEFDYQTAVALQDDKHWCRIKSVIYRRPLSDPFTALRGGTESQGIYRLRQLLLSEIASIEQDIGRIKTSQVNVDIQAKGTAEEKGQLEEDLGSWEKDVAAAGKTAAAFDERLKAATLELGGLEAAIVNLGRELRGAMAALAQTIDASAPPPVRQR